MSSRIAMLIATCVGLAGVTSVALAVSGGNRTVHNGGTVSRPAVSRSARTRVRSVDPRLIRRMRLFREARARSASDAIPTGYRSLFEAYLGPRAGANLQLARTAETGAGAIHVVPGNGEVCQIGAGTEGCGAIANLGTTGFSLISKTATDPPGTERVSGIVPDGVLSVDVVGRNGSEVSVPVSGNAFGVVMTGTTVRLDYHTDAGAVVGSPVPPSVAAVGASAGQFSADDMEARRRMVSKIPQR